MQARYLDHEVRWAVARSTTRHDRPAHTSRPLWNFVRHLLEMVAAMAVGMMLLGGLTYVVTLALGVTETFDRTSVEGLVMTVNMTTGMGLWMRYRGHRLLQIAEMAGAMFVPFAVLIYPFWMGLITSDDVMIGLHILMIPAMVGVMLFRRDVYTGHHHHEPG